MALIDFQTALGRAIRVKSGNDLLRGLELNTSERISIEALTRSVGFKFTVSVQRSWCTGRAMKAASLTLSLLEEDRRRRLLEEWIDSGAGTESFHGAEAELFFDFIRTRLPDPSHELTVCQLEQTVLRISSRTDRFSPPDLFGLDDPKCIISRGRYAGLVSFHAEPHHLLEAVMRQESLPPLLPHTMMMLFCPGVEGLCRAASNSELKLWFGLATPVGMASLLKGAHRRKTIENLLRIGALEFRTES